MWIKRIKASSFKLVIICILLFVKHLIWSTFWYNIFSLNDFLITCTYLRIGPIISTILPSTIFIIFYFNAFYIQIRCNSSCNLKFVAPFQPYILSNSIRRLYELFQSCVLLFHYYSILANSQRDTIIFMRIFAFICSLKRHH